MNTDITELESIAKRTKILKKSLLGNLEPGQRKIYKGERATKLDPAAVAFFLEEIEKHPEKYPGISVSAKKEEATVSRSVKGIFGNNEEKCKRIVFTEIIVERESATEEQIIVKKKKRLFGIWY